MSSSKNNSLVVDFDQIDAFFNEKLPHYDDSTVDTTHVAPLVFTASNLTVQKSFVLPIPVVLHSLPFFLMTILIMHAF